MGCRLLTRRNVRMAVRAVPMPARQTRFVWMVRSSWIWDVVFSVPTVGTLARRGQLNTARIFARRCVFAMTLWSMETRSSWLHHLDDKARKLFGRSLQLRQVSAGGCNGCEADINVLGTIVFDLGRFGIHLVASPRHADGLIITGPVTNNMKLALKKTYDATPAPKIVIAVGACATQWRSVYGSSGTKQWCR